MADENDVENQCPMAEDLRLEVIDLDEEVLTDDKAPLISRGNGALQHANDDSDESTRCPGCAGCPQLPHSLRAACSLACCARSAVQCFPFVRILAAYNWRKSLLPDLVAGLTVGIMNIPQGMAYAVLAELDPVVGLYVSFFAPVLYFVFGTSLQMSVGTFALASLMLADPVTRLAGDAVDPDLFPRLNLSGGNLTHAELAAARWEVALAVSLLAGLFQIGLGLLRLGFLAVLLSDALVSGFTTGAAFHVFTSQLPAVFGVRVPRHSGLWKLVKTYRELFLAAAHANVVTLSLSAVSLLLLAVVRVAVNPLVMRRTRFPIPIELLLVIAGTLVSYFLHLNSEFSVHVIGKIPNGFPPSRVPNVHLLPHLLLDAVTIAVFLFACTVSLAKIFSRKHKYALDANQEAFALGITNTMIPFFGAYLAAGSLSRSMVQDEMGGKSQIAGLISSALILIVLLAIGPLFSSVPNCVLSCIILISLRGLFMQFRELPKLWRTCKWDFAIWLVTFLATLLLDVGPGLLAGLGFSLLTVVARAHRLSLALADEVASSAGWRGIRLEGPLYFGTAERLRTRALALSGLSPLRLPLHDLSEDTDVGKEMRRLVLDCRGLSFVDSAGLRALEQLAEELEPQGVVLHVVDGPRGLLARLDTSRRDNLVLSLRLPDPDTDPAPGPRQEGEEEAEALDDEVIVA